MQRTARYTLVLILVLSAAPVFAVNIDREVVNLTTVTMPYVPIEGLDFRAVRVEVAHEDVQVGEPKLRQTNSLCAPKGSERANAA